MSTAATPSSAAAQRIAVALKLALLSAAMFGFGYLMVPLYEKICEATGINNILIDSKIDADEFAIDPTRAIRAEFVTTATGALAMTPDTQLAAIHPGETYEIFYTLKNLSDQTLFGQAVPSYSPTAADRWVKKVQCFCFDQLKMNPNETRRERVVIVIDPNLPKDIKTLSLSYTFFQIEGGA